MENKVNSFKQFSPTQKTTEQPCFAEVVEANLEQCTAQCWKWDVVPAFGSLIQIETKQHITLGIVTQISTGSMDPVRYPFPYQKTESELKAEQPQIFEFLKTTFTIQILGYLEKKIDKIYYLLPVRPCKIHAFIQESSQEVFIRFFKMNRDNMSPLFVRYNCFILIILYHVND